jgi:hypothetical protein
MDFYFTTRIGPRASTMLVLLPRQREFQEGLGSSLTRAIPAVSSDESVRTECP